MTTLDLAHLRTWIGATMHDEDVVTPRMVREFDATLAPHLFLPGPGEAPLALHWCLCPAIAPASGLGADGHPLRGGFLPPVPLPRRMWAGGMVQHLVPLRVGVGVTRRSTIADVAVKRGRSGEMCFVVVAHDYLVDGETVIRERHDIVYRGAASDAPAPAAARSPATTAGNPAMTPASGDLPRPELTWHLAPDSTMLFRYSALTFNGHRIHYDAPYATGVEAYAGLVVHGPLQATLLLQAAATLAGRSPARFDYRGVAPLIAGNAVRILAARVDDHITCWTESDAGIHMKAEAF